MDAEAIRDILSAFGPVQIRRMFGGQGIYRDGLMFALEARGELYLKADSETEGVFRDLGSRPFAYTSRDGRTSTMSYWLMPDLGLDDPDEAAKFARLAMEAAVRAKATGGVRKGGRVAPPGRVRKKS
ncbi:MAG TPA: TfoX/Sxy family protein [Microvirga sp.]|nr:TfoX/Sxy family protein [Microvirga sp.]